MDPQQLIKPESQPSSLLSSPTAQGPARSTSPRADAPAAPQQCWPGQTGGPLPPATAMQLFGHFIDTPLVPMEAPGPTVADYGAGGDNELDCLIQGNHQMRTELDAKKKSHAPDAGETEQGLNASRQQLLDQLKERSSVFDAEIKAIDDKLDECDPKNPTPEQKELLAQKASLTQSRDKYAAQQTALQRWHDRGEINAINEQLKDPSLTPEAKTALLVQKKQLATDLLSTTKHYEQFDDRWGSTVYGRNKSYTNMRQAGCGPTGLADLLDFADQEDPEGKHAAGEADPYSPRKVADYATYHGRQKGSGTSGATMMKDLSQGFPGFTGNTLQGQQGAVESLNNGIPVLFVGHKITGKGANGKNVKPYGGHFMVLDGVSDDGKDFKVEDGGRNSNRNIRSMSSDQLKRADGFWNVQ